MSKKLKGMIADLCGLLGDVLEELAETSPPADDPPARGKAKDDEPAPARRGKKKGPSIDDVRDKLTDLANERGRPATIKMLKEFKAATVDDLDEADYQEIIDAIDEEIGDAGDEDDGKGKGKGFDVDEEEEKPARGRRSAKDDDEEAAPARRGRPAGKAPARRGSSRR